MNVDPVLARTLAAVVDEGSLEAASRALHLTPSAVSQRVRLLEQTLGRRLLVRSRPVRATEAGQAVIRFARCHALIEAEAQEALGLEDEGHAPRIAIAVNSDSSATWFIAPLASFVAEHDVQVEILREDQDATAQLLESGAAMAAVTSSALASPGCSVAALGSLVYEAVASPIWWERWVRDVEEGDPTAPATSGGSSSPAGPAPSKGGVAVTRDPQQSPTHRLRPL
ncbi:ArgP/LysG family DNA-binding transcriptional regulator [Brachybacterium endophyticum]|uniref:ArgP/LysG family DNA-binding transcriptional regulator n=1 Tax=Brachybacterium endophyticum TaxID=2182385 RepID=UPI001F0C486D|nr:ArgP/LysG family DNA-binding transcriptional regulator [Brachybacterium endophyticum]